MALDELIIKYVGGTSTNSLAHILQSNDADKQAEHSDLSTLDYHYYDFNSFKSLIDTNKTKFSILSSNMQSLHAKLSELLSFLRDLQSAQFNFNIICIQKSWLMKTMTYHKSNWKTTHVSHKENQVALKGG